MKRKKSLRLRVFGDMGLSKMEHWLAYRYRGGFGHPWLPIWFKHIIVDIWNFFACMKYGHSIIGDVGDGVVINECMHCCEKVEEGK